MTWRGYGEGCHALLALSLLERSAAGFERPTRQQTSRSIPGRGAPTQLPSGVHGQVPFAIGYAPSAWINRYLHDLKKKIYV
jgi:hypothetical protein